MQQFNEQVEKAIENLKAAQVVISKMFNVSANDINIFDKTEESWQYNNRNGELVIGINEADCEFSHDSVETLQVQFVTPAIGDYCMVYATEDTYNARVNRRWNNLAYYVLKKDKEIK